MANIISLVDFERLECGLKLSITFENFGLVEVEQSQGLAKREDMLVAILTSTQRNKIPQQNYHPLK